MGRTRARGGDLPHPSIKHQSRLFSQQELGGSQGQPPSLYSLVCPDRCRGFPPPSLFCFTHNMYTSLRIKRLVIPFSHTQPRCCTKTELHLVTIKLLKCPFKKHTALGLKKTQTNQSIKPSQVILKYQNDKHIRNKDLNLLFADEDIQD